MPRPPPAAGDEYTTNQPPRGRLWRRLPWQRPTRMKRMPQPPAAGNGPDRIATGVRLSDRYDVQEVVGYGGMATVYHGRDTLLDRDVAVKVLNQRIAASDSVDRAAFLREARAAASLSHPGIAAAYDAGIFADSPYIVMEYIPGRSLKEAIDAEAPFPPDRAVDAIVQ